MYLPSHFQGSFPPCLAWAGCSCTIKVRVRDNPQGFGEKAWLCPRARGGAGGGRGRVGRCFGIGEPKQPEGEVLLECPRKQSSSIVWPTVAPVLTYANPRSLYISERKEVFWHKEHRKDKELRSCDLLSAVTSWEGGRRLCQPKKRAEGGPAISHLVFQMVIDFWRERWLWKLNTPSHIKDQQARWC